MQPWWAEEISSKTILKSHTMTLTLTNPNPKGSYDAFFKDRYFVYLV